MAINWKSVEQNSTLTKAETEFALRLGPLIEKEIRAQKLDIPTMGVVGQLIMESGYGKSYLAKNAHNYAGLTKGDSTGEKWSWDGPVIAKPDKQGEKAGGVTIVQDFRKYSSDEEFVKDYVNFIQKPRYSKAMNQNDPYNYALELGRGGYHNNNDNNYAKHVESKARRLDPSAFKGRGENIDTPKDFGFVAAGEGNAEHSVKTVEDVEKHIGRQQASRKAFDDNPSYTSEQRQAELARRDREDTGLASHLEEMARENPFMALAITFLAIIAGVDINEDARGWAHSPIETSRDSNTAYRSGSSGRDTKLGTMSRTGGSARSSEAGSLAKEPSTADGNASPDYPGKKGEFVVSIDRGHGARWKSGGSVAYDSGAVDGGYTEVMLANAFESAVQKAMAPYEQYGLRLALTSDKVDNVIYGSNGASLRDRKYYTRDSIGDAQGMFASVHFDDRVGNPYEGMKTYYYNESGKKLADDMQDKFGASGAIDTGTRYATFSVLTRETQIPSVLIECGNKHEACLRDPKWIEARANDFVELAVERARAAGLKIPSQDVVKARDKAKGQANEVKPKDSKEEPAKTDIEVVGLDAEKLGKVVAAYGAKNNHDEQIVAANSIPDIRPAPEHTV